MKLKIAGIAVLLLIVLGAWWFGSRSGPEDSPAQPPSAKESDSSAAPAAAPEPAPESIAKREEFVAPSASGAAAAAPARLRFHDWASGEPIRPVAVVWLTVAGPVQVAVAEADGAFVLPAEEPVVFAASFEAHLPLLAVVREPPRGKETAVHAFGAARIRVEFEGCDPALLPADSGIQFSVEGSRRGGGRSDHGQSRNGRRFALLAQRAGQPNLESAPADWFTPEQAAAWRTDVVRMLRSVPSEQVAAMPLTAFTDQHRVTGLPLTVDRVPSDVTLAWRTSLPLAQRDPPPADGTGTMNSENGDRFGRFEVPPGESTLRLAWAAAGSIAGSIPMEAFSGGLIEPSVTLAAIVHDEHTPVNGAHFNPVTGSVQAADGSFLFEDLAPGEYQVDAAWSVGSDLKLSATRVLLAAGQHQDLGTCAVRPGPAFHLEVRMLDGFGNALLPQAVFRDESAARIDVGLMDQAKDPLESSVQVTLRLPFGSSARVHGLRPGYVWAHTGLSYFEPEVFQSGTSFLRFDPNGDRVTFPGEDRVEIAGRFQTGALSLTLRFDAPDDAWGRRYNLHFTHLASGVQIPVKDWEAEKDPQRRSLDHPIQLSPGEYSFFAVSNVSSMAKPGEIHHYAFQKVIVESAGQVFPVKLLPGLEAAGAADLPAMQDPNSPLFFDVVSIDGVPEPSKSWFTAKIDAEKGFRLHGLPPQALLFNQDSRTQWAVNEQGILARVP